MRKVWCFKVEDEEDTRVSDRKGNGYGFWACNTLLYIDRGTEESKQGHSFIVISYVPKIIEKQRYSANQKILRAKEEKCFYLCALGG